MSHRLQSDVPLTMAAAAVAVAVASKRRHAAATVTSARRHAPARVVIASTEPREIPPGTSAGARTTTVARAIRASLVVAAMTATLTMAAAAVAVAVASKKS